MFRRTFFKSLVGAAVAMPAAASAALRPAPRTPMLLERSPLAGFQFHDGETLWRSLSIGDAVDLLREPANPHDDRAVAVRWRDRKLGYLPRTDNCAVAQLLDRNKTVSARILSLKDSHDPWKRIAIEISV